MTEQTKLPPPDSDEYPWEYLNENRGRRFVWLGVAAAMVAFVVWLLW